MAHTNPTATPLHGATILTAMAVIVGLTLMTPTSAKAESAACYAACAKIQATHAVSIAKCIATAIKKADPGFATTCASKARVKNTAKYNVKYPKECAGSCVSSSPNITSRCYDVYTATLLDALLPPDINLILDLFINPLDICL